MRPIDADALISHFESKPPDYYTTRYVVSVLNETPTVLTDIYETCEPFHQCHGKSYSLIANPNYSYCPYCGKKVGTE